jgi:molybdopterin molybdotransferase
MSDLLTIEDALSRILERASPLPTEIVAVADAAGRVLREAAVALVDLPPFASSAMDGFAVRASDTPGTLRVAYRVAAGEPSFEELPPGAVAGIATGATVPEGADAVVPVERAADRGDRVEIPEAARFGQHVRPRGGDVRAGDIAIVVGTRLGPAQIGALEAAGVAEISCSVRPRVAVLATGSELRPAGEPLSAGQIYESNRAMVGATLRSVGADVELLPVAADHEVAHRTLLERGLEADVLVSTGGVSMGPHDLVRRAAADLGVEEVFWGVAVKPGKPLFFGIRGATLVFGLPGNPVSSLVGALVFIRPALLRRQGVDKVELDYHHGRTVTSLVRNPHRDEFVRARRRVEATDVFLEPVAGQESHMIVRAASADALVHVPRGAGEIAADAPVRFLSLA